MLFLNYCTKNHLTPLSPYIVEQILYTATTMFKEGLLCKELKCEKCCGFLNTDYTISQIGFFGGPKFEFSLEINHKIIIGEFVINTLIINYHSFINIQNTDIDNFIRFDSF